MHFRVSADYDLPRKFNERNGRHWDVSNMGGLITIQTAAQAPNPDGDTGTLGMAYNISNGGWGTSHGLRLAP